MWVFVLITILISPQLAHAQPCREIETAAIFFNFQGAFLDVKPKGQPVERILLAGARPDRLGFVVGKLPRPCITTISGGLLWEPEYQLWLPNREALKAWRKRIWEGADAFYEKFGEDRPGTAPTPTLEGEQKPH